MGWSNLKDQFEIDDIGGRLLANLAKGIYSHEAVLREYVQNAADAYAQLAASGTTQSDPTITITVEQKKSLSIYDSGFGMNKKAIREAKKIAVSPKAGLNLTGFRGIGIWAGFQACDQLRVVTKRKGDTHRYRLTLDFKEILKHVDEDLNIKQLLDNRFRLEEEDGAPVGEHYTQVTLVGLHAEYEKLLDEGELKRIVGQNLPCRVDPKFKFKAEVEKFVNAADGYQEFRVVVGKSEVFKDFPTDVDAPSFEVLKEGSVEVAKVWWCTGWSALKAENGQYRSFRLRVRNFAVGRVGIYDDEDASPYGVMDNLQIKLKNRLNWHVGEIHITHDDIVPDTPRTHLEMNALSRNAIARIRSFYADRIAEAGARSEFRGMEKLIDRGEEELKAGSMTQESASEILSGLNEQEQALVGKTPTNQAKKILRSLLSEQGIKSRRRKLIKNIEAKQKQLPKAGGGKAGASTGGAAAGGSGTGVGSKSSGAAGAGTTAAIDFEALLSEIIAIVTEQLDDDEVIGEVAGEIQKLFQKNKLIPAP